MAAEIGANDMELAKTQKAETGAEQGEKAGSSEEAELSPEQKRQNLDEKIEAVKKEIERVKGLIERTIAAFKKAKMDAGSSSAYEEPESVQPEKAKLLKLQSDLAGLEKQRDELVDEREKPQASQERRERIPVEEVRFIHIDDAEETRENVAKGLADTLGMKNELGEAGSAEEAIELINKLVEKGERLDLIILDQQFFRSKGDEMVDTRGKAAIDVVENLQRISETEKGKLALERTKVIIFSGTADDEFLDRLQKISNKVIGRGDKDRMENNKFATGIAGLLAESGVIEETDKIKEMKVENAVYKFNEKILNTSIPYMNKVLNRPDHPLRQKLLTLINETRQKLNIPLMVESDPSFTSIVNLLVEDGQKIIDKSLLLSLAQE